MGRVASVWLLVSLGGCAQLFGIDDTTGPTGGDDAPPPATTLAYTRISIGANAVRAPLDVTANTATYIPPDATDPSGIRRVPTTLVGTNEWTAPLTAAAPVFFDLPDFP